LIVGPMVCIQVLQIGYLLADVISSRMKVLRIIKLVVKTAEKKEKRRIRRSYRKREFKPKPKVSSYGQEETCENLNEKSTFILND